MADGESGISIRDRLLKERETLLDLSTRNRLLNTPLRTRNNRAIEIVDEKAVEVFRLLTSGKGLGFLPGVPLGDEERAELDPADIVTGGVPQAQDDAFDDRGVALRHNDFSLRTRLTSEGLQKRLFDVWYDALTLEQEQGVNILYLAVGLLRWFDNDSSDVARHAPLVLLPVKLERSSAADRFKLKWRDEPPSPNLTLQAKMKVEFGLGIEDFPDEDEVDLAAYAARVAQAVSAQKRWEVLPDAMVLGFFSFSKFLMYRDLNPDTWPEHGDIGRHPLVSGLLRDGFEESAPLVADGDVIDAVIRPLELHHVVDADSSQTIVIAEAAAGRTLVVKGPPGTGKSQTITNIVAAAVARGKKVLFVAEKMAALDVVHRRLRQVGLGPLTLELHSNKVSKRAVLDELRRTRDGQLQIRRGDPSVITNLTEASDDLNAFARRLHAPLQPSGLSPYAILGLLARTPLPPGGAVFALAGAETWEAAAVDARRAIARRVTERLRVIGDPSRHAWLGVGRDPIDPMEQARLVRDITEMRDRLSAATTIADVLSQVLDAPRAATVGDIGRALHLLGMAATPPELDRAALAAPEWSSFGCDRLAELVEAGRAYNRAWAAASERFNDTGLTASYSALRTAIVTKGARLFRFLDGDYRAQVALLRSYLRGEPPKVQKDRVALIDQAIAAQTAKTRFEALQAGGVCFGSAWRSERSDWDALAKIVEWRNGLANATPALWRAFASTAEVERLAQAREALAGAWPKAEAALETVLGGLRLDPKRAFGVAGAGSIPLPALLDRAARWLDEIEALGDFIAFAAAAAELAESGCVSLTDAIYEGGLAPDAVASAFDVAYAEVLRVALFEDWPELRGFDGDAHNARIAVFRHLDRARIELAQEQIVTTHAEGRPRAAAGIGPLGVLNGEMAKKRSHLPIRVLLERAGPAIQQLKPVFMMSPLSVAQFLKPGGPTFDLLVMDEASQIEPVDALGSIARAKQLVVVGDERQLPPTSFFKKLTGEEEPEEADDGVTIQAKDAESILELCLAKGVPHRMLSWHYRSKHQSLIAVSNREFYENRLFIVPSPYDAMAGMGLKFNRLDGAPYDRGGTRTNPVEARIVAEAVIAHARSQPELSLGVATFSVAQRQAVLKELELLRRKNPDVEDFFAASGAEPFFVKNLENLQGDERDVIFISIGYGKTEQGYLAHAFGPLSGEGGERRLNVLISRAKLRCEVFCNFTGADIDLDRTRARGVAALKLFLTFAETGGFGLGEPTGADFDSGFEQDICERLQALGYEVRRQIGASGFRVDLGIVDPERPGRFALGIECDGAQFHSSRSARDRDRLRQQVLEAHGWIIHRVWSADWYLRPQRELKKLQAAITAARQVWTERDEGGYRPPPTATLSFEADAVDDVAHVTAVLAHAPAEPSRNVYVEAAFPVDRSLEPHQAPLGVMADYVSKVVELEGPVHLDEVVARIRSLWGMARAGGRIRAAVEAGLQHAVRTGQAASDDDAFYRSPGRPVVARDRSAVASAGLRKAEMLPPSEIEAALLQVVDANFGAGMDELVQSVSRLFGFAATSAQLRAVLTDCVHRAVDNGALVRKGELLVRPGA